MVALLTHDDVDDNDTANKILRSSSSIFKALEYVKNTNDWFRSAGNTAAIMILSRLQLGDQGNDRPAICSLIPNEKLFHNAGFRCKCNCQSL